MRRRCTLASALLAALSIGISPVSADSDAVYADTFDDLSFSGSDGTLPLSAPWTEIGESDGPGAGDVRVQRNGQCRAGACLRIDGAASRRGAARRVDLGGATLAVLELAVAQIGPPGGHLVVRISPDGGRTWTSLAKLGRHDAGTMRFDVTRAATKSSLVAIDVSPGSTHSSFVDDFRVFVSYDDPPRPVEPSDDGKGGPPPHAEPSGKPHATTTTTTLPTTTTRPPGAGDTPPTGSSGTAAPRNDVLIGIAIQHRSFAPPAWTATEESAIRAGVRAAALSEALPGVRVLRGDLAPLTQVAAPLTRPGPGVRSRFVPTALFGALLAWATITGFERRRSPRAQA